MKSENLYKIKYNTSPSVQTLYVLAESIKDAHDKYLQMRPEEDPAWIGEHTTEHHLISIKYIGNCYFK